MENGDVYIVIREFPRRHELDEASDLLGLWVEEAHAREYIENHNNIVGGQWTVLPPREWRKQYGELQRWVNHEGVLVSLWQQEISHEVPFKK